MTQLGRNSSPVCHICFIYFQKNENTKNNRCMFVIKLIFQVETAVICILYLQKFWGVRNFFLYIHDFLSILFVGDITPTLWIYVKTFQELVVLCNVELDPHAKHILCLLNYLILLTNNQHRRRTHGQKEGPQSAKACRTFGFHLKFDTVRFHRRPWRNRHSTTA